MKTCPNCNEIIGDSAQICFKCNYNFKYKQVLTKEEQKQLEKNEEKQKNILQEEANVQIPKNPYFEYRTVIVNNLETGEINQTQLQAALNTYAENGWKLHSVFNNELGKTSSSVAIGFLGSTVNATIDQTVLIFERCIKAGTD